MIGIPVLNNYMTMMMMIDTPVLDNYMMMMMMTHRSLIIEYTTPTNNRLIII